jgi:hypothetical protein
VTAVNALAFFVIGVGVGMLIEYWLARDHRTSSVTPPDGLAEQKRAVAVQPAGAVVVLPPEPDYTGRHRS